MITHVTYREARFGSMSATLAAVDKASALGWSASSISEERRGQYVVLFRMDQEPLADGSFGPRAELPVFAQNTDRETRQTKVATVPGPFRSARAHGLLPLLRRLRWTAGEQDAAWPAARTPRIR